MRKIKRVFILPIILLIVLASIPVSNALNTTPVTSACEAYPTVEENWFQDDPGNTVNYVSSNTQNRVAILHVHNGTCGTLDVKVQGWSDFVAIAPWFVYADGYNGATQQCQQQVIYICIYRSMFTLQPMYVIMAVKTIMEKHGGQDMV